jgi:hypothetical protein
MSMIWNRRTSDSVGLRGDSEGDSLRMIPLWSVVLAILVFFGTMYFLNMAGPAPPADAARRNNSPAQQQQRRRVGGEAGRLMFSYTTATALASYILLVGYVSRDVRRRNMPVAPWMLIVVVTLGAGGIGAIVYFLLRQPIMMRCPNCTTELAATVHFCPQCQFQVAPVCGQCFRGVQITDQFCVQCGHEVAEDHAPARLCAYSDSN